MVAFLYCLTSSRIGSETNGQNGESRAQLPKGPFRKVHLPLDKSAQEDGILKIHLAIEVQKLAMISKV